MLKVEDEHAADPLVVHRTERQVVDEDDRRFAGNNEEKSKKIERMRSMLYVQSNTLSCGGEKRSAYPRPAGTKFEYVDAQELCPALLVPLAFRHLRREACLSHPLERVERSTVESCVPWR